MLNDDEGVGTVDRDGPLDRLVSEDLDQLAGVLLVWIVRTTALAVLRSA